MNSICLHIRNFSAQKISNGSLEIMEELLLTQGKTLIVVGLNDSGKSHFACVLGQLDETKTSDPYLAIEGHLDPVAEFNISELVAVVPSNPNLMFSLISKTLKQEIALGWSFLGRAINEKKLKNLLKDFQLEHLSDRDPMTLSGGEKVRAAVAMALAKKPKLLILDNVFDELNPTSQEMVRRNISRYQNDYGLITIELHSKAPDYSEENNQWLFLLPRDIPVLGSLSDCCRIIGERNPYLLPKLANIGILIEKCLEIKYDILPLNIDALIKPIRIRTLDTNENESAINKEGEAIAVKNLTFQYSGASAFSLGPIELSIEQKKTTAILGKNGAGKTTLLKCLGNLNRGWKGRIATEEGALSPKIPLHKWARQIVYCFQNPEDQLFLATVEAELKETAKRTRGKNFPIAERVKEIAEVLGIDDYLSTSPLSLPRPFQRLVAMGSAFVADPKIILLDEPTAGLDNRLAEKVEKMIGLYNSDGGTTLMISHDYNFVCETSENIIVMDNGLVNYSGPLTDGKVIWPGNNPPIVPNISKHLMASRNIYRQEDLMASIEIGN